MRAKKTILILHELAPRLHRNAKRVGPDLRAGRLPSLHLSGPPAGRVQPSNRRSKP
jgi:hypothetical protein